MTDSDGRTHRVPRPRGRHGARPWGHGGRTSTARQGDSAEEGNGDRKGAGGPPGAQGAADTALWGPTGTEMGQDRGGGARSPVHDAWSQSVTQCHAEQDAASVPCDGHLVHRPGLRVTHNPWCMFLGLKRTALIMRDLVLARGLGRHRHLTH